MHVSIVLTDDVSEALLLRALLENFGAQVHLHAIGKPSDFFTAFDCFGTPADLAIIAGHGDEGGLIFPEMGEGVDTLVLPNNRITPGLLTGFKTPLPKVVISTACDSGRPDFARAFHAAGAELYIAPRDYPTGSVVPVLLALALHRVVEQGSGWLAAIAAANAAFDEDDGFVVFPA
jgi:hypothetical protein